MFVSMGEWFGLRGGMGDSGGLRWEEGESRCVGGRGLRVGGALLVVWKCW